MKYRMMEEENLEEETNTFFNGNYDGRYRTKVDIDRDENEAYIFVAFEEGSEKPGIGGFVDKIFEELDISNPRIEASWEQEYNMYNITLKEDVDEPIPGQTHRTSV